MFLPSGEIFGDPYPVSHGGGGGGGGGSVVMFSIDFGLGGHGTHPHRSRAINK